MEGWALGHGADATEHRLFRVMFFFTTNPWDWSGLERSEDLIEDTNCDHIERTRFIARGRPTAV